MSALPKDVQKRFDSFCLRDDVWDEYTGLYPSKTEDFFAEELAHQKAQILEIIKGMKKPLKKKLVYLLDVPVYNQALDDVTTAIEEI